MRSLSRISVALFTYSKLYKPPLSQRTEEVAQTVFDPDPPLPPITIDPGRNIEASIKLKKPSQDHTPTLILHSPQEGILQIQYVGTDTPEDKIKRVQRNGPFWLLSYGNLHLDNQFNMEICDVKYPVDSSVPFSNRGKHLIKKFLTRKRTTGSLWNWNLPFKVMRVFRN